MLQKTLLLILTLALALGTNSVARAAQAKEDPLAEQVRKAIETGIQYLREQEAGTGSWEGPIGGLYPGGATSLALLALLNSGLSPNDDIIERGLKSLREVTPTRTYVVAVQTMVFAAAGKTEDAQRIRRNVDWLIEAQVMNGDQLLGWDYNRPGRLTDNSVSQYALLGLYEGHRAGATVPRDVWESIRQFYITTQGGDGSWDYGRRGPGRSHLTMTPAGLAGLFIASMQLNKDRETLLGDGTAQRCGKYDDNDSIGRALDWLSDKFSLEKGVGPVFYNLYGIERAGRLSGRRFFLDHDWYREGCEYLVKNRNGNGSWRSNSQQDGGPVISTSFALLFLSKGRTPVLISKLLHGPGEDWNNDRNDARMLTEFVSKELFKGQPLAWQVFEAKRHLGDTQKELLDTTAELLQSPIAYFNGHEAPRFTAREEEMLKEYVNQGGFVLAEACCGRQEFDTGFRQLMQKLFPGNPLKPLPAEHAVWRAYFPVQPGAYALEGIQMGCKTVVVYSPKDLSCRWETDTHDKDKENDAFRVGANIVAYATGMELPKPRLTKVEVVAEPDQKKVPRGHIKVAQLKYEGDWQPAPNAMRNLMGHLRDQMKLTVALETEALSPGSKNLFEYKFLYMHGRGHFTFSKHELEILRSNIVETGALLLADACCGKEAFDKAFRQLVAELFPGQKLERIPVEDDLFSKELNGRALTSVRCRRKAAGAGDPEGDFQNVQPNLEGIKINNRWAVIYSKYDLGCALERHQSPDCLGHDHESALRLASAAVLYALKR